MLAFRLFPPPHGMPMAGEGVPHTKCGTKRAWRAAPETRAERSSLQCPPSAERAALRLAVRERRCAKFPVAGEFVLSGYVLRCRRVSFGYLSGDCRMSVETLSGIDRMPARHLSVPYQIQRCRNDKRFSRNGNTAKARRKDRNYNISAMPDPAALCATAK